MRDNIRKKEELKEETKEKKVKGEERNRGMVVVPSVQGLTDKVSRVFKKRRVRVACKAPFDTQEHSSTPQG